MDRDLDTLLATPAVSGRRLWLAFGLAAAVIAVGSLGVRAFPEPGRLAGRQAVLDKGPAWVHTKVDIVTGTSLGVCDALQRESIARRDSPDYRPESSAPESYVESYYASFVTGCGEAVDDLLGRHVPLLPAGDRTISE